MYKNDFPADYDCQTVPKGGKFVGHDSISGYFIRIE